MKLDREDWENALATLLIALTVSETSKIILKKKNCTLAVRLNQSGSQLAAHAKKISY